MLRMGSIAGDKSSAPRFVQKPQLRQEDEGNRLIFECELGGFPQPEVFWFREDTQITPDQRTNVKVTPTDKKTFIVVLELNDVVESDAGLYKIRSKNKFGDWIKRGKEIGCGPVCPTGVEKVFFSYFCS